MRETRGGVVRIGCAREISGVTAETVGRSSGEAGRMAVDAFQTCMGSRQLKAGKACVVEPGTEPRIEVVAFVALERQLCRLMVGSARGLIIRLMACDAFRAQTHEYAGCCRPVAGIALHGSMGAHERKTVLMPLNGLERDLPAAHRVARIAFASKLAPVKVGMAAGTICAGIAEGELRVAEPAVDAHVQPAEREPRLSVIEIRRRPYGPPACGRMTVLAGDRQRSMRAPGAAPHGL